MRGIAETPAPPYYAVVFTARRTADLRGYAEMSREMRTLAAQQDGFLGIESANEDVGIVVSYWRDLAAIQKWKSDIRHREAQRRGREQWYADYQIRIAKVERAYGKFGDNERARSDFVKTESAAASQKSASSAAH